MKAEPHGKTGESYNSVQYWQPRVAPEVVHELRNRFPLEGRVTLLVIPPLQMLSLGEVAPTLFLTNRGDSRPTPL